VETVDSPRTNAELTAIRRRVHRGRPFTHAAEATIAGFGFGPEQALLFGSPVSAASRELASDDASSIGSSSDCLASFATIAARSVSLAE